MAKMFFKMAHEKPEKKVTRDALSKGADLGTVEVDHEKHVWAKTVTFVESLERSHKINKIKFGISATLNLGMIIYLALHSKGVL